MEPAAKPRSGLATLGRSLAINLVGPWLVLKVTAPLFPPASLAPLLLAMSVPAAALALGLMRHRRVDAVAVISLSQLFAGLLIGVLARGPQASLVGHAFQPMVQGVVFALSVLVGRPLMIPLARQAMCGDDPARQARFDAAMASSAVARWHMAAVTLAWTVAMCAQTGVELLAVHLLPAATYLTLTGPLGLGVQGLLIWGSIRYGDRMREQLRANGPLSPEAEAS
jgi:hypothetical protein